MLRDLADWNVSAFLGGRGKLAKYFRRCSAEDAVILLLPTVRMRFIVQPSEWIDWMFVAVPVRAETSDKVLIFRIEHSGWPTA